MPIKQSPKSSNKSSPFKQAPESCYSFTIPGCMLVQGDDQKGFFPYHSLKQKLLSTPEV